MGRGERVQVQAKRMPLTSSLRKSAPSLGGSGSLEGISATLLLLLLLLLILGLVLLQLLTVVSPGSHRITDFAKCAASVA